MKKISYVALLFINLICMESYAALQSGEGIVLNSVTGDYLFSYRDGGGVSDPLTQITFIPSTKIDPLLSSSIILSGNWNVLYGYVLANGLIAKQAINSLNFSGLPVNANIAGGITITEGSRSLEIFTLTSPNANWYGGGTRVPKERAPPNGEVNVDWHYSYKSEYQDPLLAIQPGASLGGFGLVSTDLPGMIAAQVQGNGSFSIGFPGEAPYGDALNLYEQLLAKDSPHHTMQR
jgi:hypothetical protein